MIERFLKFTIRKNIERDNKKINHRAYVSSLTLGDKIPYLAKYHKKKLILLVLGTIIIYTYDLQRPIYRKIMSLRAPTEFLQSLFIKEKKIPSTISEQSWKGVSLNQSTIDLLTKLFEAADKELYFGVGRTYLYNVYKEMDLIQTPEEIKKFWISSGFYKERNQKASGVSMTQFLQIFEDGLKHKRKSHQIREEEFLQIFANKFIEKAPQIQRWERNFNRERMAEYIKNVPGDNILKQNAILEIMKNKSSEEDSLLSLEDLEAQIVSMGLKGLNYIDKFLYWQITRTWNTLQLYNIEKKLAHPLTTQVDKSRLLKQRDKISLQVTGDESNEKSIEQKYQSLYHQPIIA